MLVNISSFSRQSSNTTSTNRGTSNIEQDIIFLNPAVGHFHVSLVVNKGNIIDMKTIKVNILATEKHDTFCLV